MDATLIAAGYSLVQNDRRVDVLDKPANRTFPNPTGNNQMGRRHQYRDLRPVLSWMYCMGIAPQTRI